MAGFVALAVKGRPDFAGILGLAMLIIGETGAKADLVQETAASIDLSPQIGARLVHVQPHILRLCRRIERITEGNAIKAVEMADREAQITAFCDKGYRSEEHTSELQSLMRISYAVFCLKKKKQII